MEPTITLHNSDYLIEQYVGLLYTEGKIANITKAQVDKAISNYQKNMVNMENVLKRHKVNMSMIKKHSTKIGKIILDGFKNKIDPKDMNSNIKASFKNAYDDLNLTLGDKVAFSIIFIGMVLIFYNAITFPLVFLFGVQFAQIVGSVILTPFIEEYAKRLSVKWNFPYLYTSIFSIYELIIYVLDASSFGTTSVIMFINRIAPLLLHFFTTYIQKSFEDEYIETGKKTYSTMGYVAAVLIHMMWNFMALMAH